MKYRIHILLLALLSMVTIGSVKAQDTLPMHHQGDIAYLRDLKNDKLQTALKEEIYKNKKWRQLVENKKMAIGIVDLRDTSDVRFAALNDDYMMYAASLPKIAILLTVMKAIHDGELEETNAIRIDMHSMISKSSNAAATRLLDAVGYEKIEQTLRNSYHKLYDENYGGGLWVGKRYASAGKRYPDPIKGLSHAATVSMVCEFYYQLAFGKLVDETRSAEMLGVLKDPLLTHKFVNTLKRIAPNVAIYRKSGTWKQYHADSVLVWGPGRKYILVALIEDPDGGAIMKKLVEPVERAFKTVVGNTM